jgi:hypothetical protein
VSLPSAPSATDACEGAISGTTAAGPSFGQGDYTILWTFTDSRGNRSTQAQAVHVHDTLAPEPDAPSLPEVTGQCGVSLPGAPSATDACEGAISGTTAAGPSFGQGDYTILWTFTDSRGNRSTQAQAVHVHDTSPPRITAPPALTVSTDPGSCSAAKSGLSLGTPVTSDNCGVASVANNAPASFPLGATTVTWTVTDGGGQSATDTQLVTVTNPAPAVSISGPAGGSVFPINTLITFSGSWTDANGGSHAAQWYFDGVLASDAVTYAPSATGTSGSVSTTHKFTATGVYMVTLKVTDPCGGQGASAQVGGLDAMVVIFDPSAGFVTGGGYVISPPGAYAADPSLVGKASFGFVSKYQKGARIPTGETEFQFKAGSLNFHSGTYEWLVISGPSTQYKGSGTINGASGYDFMLTGWDGQIAGGGGVDKFRIKITNHASSAVVYDNQLGAPDTADASTALAGGSIEIHNTKNVMTARAGGETDLGLPVDFALAPNAPNPFSRSTLIRFELAERSRVTIRVFDVSGRQVASLADGDWQAGSHAITWSPEARGTAGDRAGMYFVRMTAAGANSQRHFESVRKMTLIR